MIKTANKISIIGGSGTGKTTLAENLGKKLNLPVCHIDGIHHLPNWQIRDKDERDKIILEKIKKEKWIIDGTYRSTLSERLKNSDLVIYLDFSSIAQAKGVLRRVIKHKGEEKKEIPGCKEQMTLKFFIWVLKWRKNHRKEIIEKISQIDSNRILIFKNRKKLNEWYYKEFKEKIKID